MCSIIESNSWHKIINEMPLMRIQVHIDENNKRSEIQEESSL